MSEILLRRFDLLRDVDEEAAVRDLTETPDFFGVSDFAEFDFEPLARVPFDLVALTLLVLLFAVLPFLFAVEPLLLPSLPLLLAAPAFLRKRRWVFAMASTSSSFLIECQPAIP